MKIPRSVESEKAIIGGLLLDPRVLGSVSALQADDFWGDDNRRIFQAIRGMAGDNKEIDILTICERLRSEGDEQVTPDMLTALLIGVPKLSSLAAYADIVIEKSRARKLLHLAKRLYSSVLEGLSVAEVLSDGHSELLKIGQLNGSRIKSASEAMDALLEQVEAGLKAGRSLHLQTTFPSLNRMTGGIAKNRFYVLTARPAVGKTALAVNWINAWNLAGKKVMFFSLEMSTSDLAGRMVSLLSDVNASTLLNRAHELTTQQVKQIAAAAKRLSTNNCYICDAPVITPEEMLWNCQEAYHRMGGIDVVLIDYLQLIRSKSRNDRHTRADYVADVTRSINAMCKQVAPVIALAQLSREGQKAPTMSNVKESGQIEQDANCVMILHREKVGKDEGGKDVYDHVLMVDKNRDGPTGNIPLSFELRTMAFSEIDSDGMPV